MLRSDPAELRRLCEATPYSRREFEIALDTAEDPMEEARRVWVRARQSVNGVARVPGNWSRPTVSTSNRQRRGETKLASLESFARRLRRVAIDCRDAVDVIDRYAERHVAIYLDPPYHPNTRRTYGRDAYAHDMSAGDHERLLSAALRAVRVGARVAISGYACEPYEAALDGWRRVEMATHANSTTTGGRMGRVEVLWMSYPAECELGAQASLDLEVRP